jgi:chromosome segregation ATPase
MAIYNQRNEIRLRESECSDSL